MNNLQTYTLEPLYLSNRHLLCKDSNDMLNEGVKETILDSLQFIVGAITEYGLVATVAGAPAGPVIETITDAGFMTESIASSLATLNSIANLFGELKNIVEQLFSLSLESGFDSFYDQVKSIWQSIGKILPKAGEKKIEELVNKAKKTIKDVVSKIGDFISDAVKLIIPDAVIGTTAGEGLQKLLLKIADNAYSVLTGAIGMFGTFEKVVTNPDYAQKLFNSIFDGIEDLLEKLQEKMKEEPEGVKAVVSMVSKVANPASIVVDNVKEKALAAFIDFIKSKRPEILALVDKISRVLFPLIFSLLASYQILMKGEWKKSSTENSKEKKDDSEEEESAIDQLLAAGFKRRNLIGEVTGGGIGVPQQIGYGKNYHTANPDPITWENLDGPEYFVTTQADGTVLAGVSLPGTDMATPTYSFGDEASAMSWVRNTFDKFRRELMAQ